MQRAVCGVKKQNMHSLTQNPLHINKYGAQLFQTQVVSTLLCASAISKQHKIPTFQSWMFALHARSLSEKQTLTLIHAKMV
jgi:hypothetical protein